MEKVCLFLIVACRVTFCCKPGKTALDLGLASIVIVFIEGKVMFGAAGLAIYGLTNLTGFPVREAEDPGCFIEDEN